MSTPAVFLSRNYAAPTARRVLALDGKKPASGAVGCDLVSQPPGGGQAVARRARHLRRTVARPARHRQGMRRFPETGDFGGLQPIS
jgi:hypothetical protein